MSKGVFTAITCFANKCDGEFFTNLSIQNNVRLLQLRITTPSMVLAMDDGSVG